MPRPHVLAGALAATLLATASLPASADEAPTRPDKHESDAYPPSRVRLPTILGGLGFTAAFWGLDTGTSYLWPDVPGFVELRKPVVGPWLALANNSCEGECGFFYYFNAVWFTLSGLAQAGGLAVALEGVFVPTGPGRVAAPPAGAPPGGAPRAPSQPPTESPPPESSPPGGKPLFYLPKPMPIGQGGVGIGLGGVF